jgi:prophage tail gpP-like protein
VIKTPKHSIAVVVEGQQVRGWISYQISTSLTDGVDTFSMRVPFSRASWSALRPDRPAQILVDGVPIITGWIDDSDCSDEGDTIEITGRNKIGRLVQESAPGINYAGLAIADLIERVAKPWFSKVSFDNSRNRTIIRGKGKKASSARARGFATLSSKVGTQIEPGQSRWAVISQLCEQVGVLAWSSGDGKELIVSGPNYDQAIQFRFFRPAPGSDRADDSTVRTMAIRRSTGDRYSRVLVVGSGTGTDVNYGAKVASRSGEAKNNPATADGVGIDFTAPKQLVLQRAVASSAEATKFAEAEMSRRDGQGNAVTVLAGGHGQVIAGLRTTLFACDTLGAVEDERTGLRGTYAIVGCAFTSERVGAEETTITLVPRGTELSR